MKLAKYIANLGYGSRREVAAMLASGRVRHRAGGVLRDRDVVSHEEVLIDGDALDPRPGTVIMLHKPVGHVCSTSDLNPLVYDLLPPRFRHRNPIIAPVGRLDKDTSGLLLLTDDGKLNHRITSPRADIPKTYEVELAEDLMGDEAEIFARGELLLAAETQPLQPAAMVVLGSRSARITLREGRYHQVRRMFAAVGNHVVSLHRGSLGALALGDLPPGEWRVLTAAEVGLITEG